jgi:hypothetical protein
MEQATHEPTRRQPVAAEAAELAARVRMMLPQLLDVTADTGPVASAAAAAVLLDQTADALDEEDSYPVTHARCGRPHRPFTPCPTGGVV